MIIHDCMSEAYFLSSFCTKVSECPRSPACNREGSKRKWTTIVVASLAPINHKAPRFYFRKLSLSASSAELGSAVPAEV